MELKLTKKNALKHVKITIALFFLSIFYTGAAQSGNRDINSYAYSNVVEMVVDALKDSSISIALCKVPVTQHFLGSIFDNEEERKKYMRISTDMMSRQIQLVELLRGIEDIDSLFYLSQTFTTREGAGAYLPPVFLVNDSEWILFLKSPFSVGDPFDASLTERYEEIGLQEILNSHNYFTLYEMGNGGLCTYCPEDAKYPPEFAYSENLVDDFKTIIMLMKNYSLLKESDVSYETYYDSMKDDLGRRVFARLFGNTINTVNMIIDALNDSNITIALCKVPDSTLQIESKSEVTDEKFNRYLIGLTSKQLQVIEILRSNGSMDSLIFLDWINVVLPNGNYRDGSISFRPFFFPWRGSEWIMLLDSPFIKRPDYNVSLMQRYKPFLDKSFLNSNNFFTLYEMDAGALPVRFAEGNMYPEIFLYSNKLIDDFKTIIKLHDNPSLLNESSNSYEIYYNSMKDELGKRVFSRMFGNPDRE